MKIIQKSIIRRLLLASTLFGLLIGAVVGYVFLSDGVVSGYVLVIALIVFLLFFLLFYYFDVLKPLKVVLNEMLALLAGKNYKRIYSTRVDEVGILAHFFNEVTKGLSEISHDVKDRDRILTELSVATELQKDILPPKSPEVDGLQIVAKNRPATELGGDSFSFIKKDSRLFFYVGDVTGHGIAAGLIMTMVNSLISVFADVYNTPYEILVQVNKYIKRHVKKAMFMTLVMLMWDEKAKQLSFVGAGHEHILVYRADSGVCEAILSGGVALGMVPDNSKVIKEQPLDLDVGDFVVLYSDGITEARNVEGELYGLDRLKEKVSQFCKQYSADGVHYHIARDVVAFMGEHAQDDDMTLIVVKRDDDKLTASGNMDGQSTNWQ